jgi:hypothetical protein
VVSKAEDDLAQEIRRLRLPKPEREHHFAKADGRRWRFDFAWPERKVACEVEGGVFVGGYHNRGVGYTLNCEKYNEAAVRGWLVLRVTPAQIRDGSAIYWIKEAFNAHPA